MKVALIPPLGWEKYLLHSDIHLALALPNLIANPFYTSHFKNAAVRGDYVIIDNGAAEGQLQSNLRIKRAANAVDATEIVLPDAIGDRTTTRDLIAAYLRSHADAEFKYMAVLQGTSFPDVMRLVEQLESVPSVTTLGIPRHFMRTIGPMQVRIHLAQAIETLYPGRYQLHLLGTDAKWINEVKAAAKYAGFIRSVDTSMPFNYGIAGYSLEQSARERREVYRPGDYFEAHRAHTMQEGLVVRNIKFLQAMATEKAHVE